MLDGPAAEESLKYVVRGLGLMCLLTAHCRLVSLSFGSLAPDHQTSAAHTGTVHTPPCIPVLWLALGMDHALPGWLWPGGVDAPFCPAQPVTPGVSIAVRLGVRKVAHHVAPGAAAAGALERERPAQCHQCGSHDSRQEGVDVAPQQRQCRLSLQCNGRPAQVAAVL